MAARLHQFYVFWTPFRGSGTMNTVRSSCHLGQSPRPFAGPSFAVSCMLNWRHICASTALRRVMFLLPPRRVCLCQLDRWLHALRGLNECDVFCTGTRHGLFSISVSLSRSRTAARGTQAIRHVLGHSGHWLATSRLIHNCRQP